MQNASGNRSAAIGLVVVAVLFFALAAFYWTQETSLLASSTAIHHKHALVAAGLGVLALIGANIVRPKTS
jgi:hypothetical protein